MMTFKLIRTTSVIAVTAFSMAALCAASQSVRAEPDGTIRLAQKSDRGEGQTNDAQNPNADGKAKGEGRRRDGNRPEGGQRTQRGEGGRDSSRSDGAPTKTTNKPEGGKPNLPKIINKPEAVEKRDVPATSNPTQKQVLTPVTKPNVLPPKADAKTVSKPVTKSPDAKPVVQPNTQPPPRRTRETTGNPPAGATSPAKTAEPPVRDYRPPHGLTPSRRVTEPDKQFSQPNRRQLDGVRPTVPVVAKTPVKNLDEAKSGRVERREDGGKRVVIVEKDKRQIVKQGDKIAIQKDEAAQLRRLSPNAVVTRDRRGRDRTVVERRDNTQVITETDRSGQLLRRYRRDRDGRETVIIDNRRRSKDKFGRNLAIGVGVGAGIIAGAAILNSVVDVPPPRVRVPRDKYIVDYERASEDDVYEALNAPPVDDIDRSYTLDQVRATSHLRERMRRVDLDDITFETGSWDIDPNQYRKLERIARAMRRVINRNPNEVFLIEGYTDAVGSEVDNLTLSDRRAEAVSVVLTEEFEVPFENLTTQGYGEQYLKIPTDGPERANRRVAARRITPLLNSEISAAPPPPQQPDYDDRDDRYDEPPRQNRWRRYN